jgi:type II secretory pathway pseudopilin PulG
MRRARSSPSSEATAYTAAQTTDVRGGPPTSGCSGSARNVARWRLFFSAGQGSPRCRTPWAFTLVELLVVITIIGTLVGLLLPAVQAAREAANRSSCGNNLKQIGLAIHGYHDARRVLPAAREVSTGAGWNGPTWCYFLLPYMEQRALYDSWPGNGKAAGGYAAFAEPNGSFLSRTQVSTWYCPARRGPLVSSEEFSVADPVGALGDYAVAASDAQSTYNSADPSLAVGAIIACTNNPARQSQTRFASITDGLSKTLFVGEKFVPQSLFGRNRLPGNGPRINDTCIYNGNSAPVTLRAAGLGVELVADPRLVPTNNNLCVRFGSSHPGLCQFVLGDGSVRGLDVTTSGAILSALVTRSGAENSALVDP